MSYIRAVMAVAGISNLEKANIFLPRSFSRYSFSTLFAH